MSIFLMNRVRDDYSLNDKLTSSEKVVLSRYADYARDDGTSTYPSFNRISRETALSKRQVIRIVKSLVKKGYLIKVKEADRINHRATEYRINIDMIRVGRWDKSVHKLSTKSVDKNDTVSLSSDMVSLPPSDMVSPDQLVTSIKHDYVGEIKTVNKFELIERLMNIKVKKQHAICWLDYFGCDKIEAELELIAKQTWIRNPGAYLRYRLHSNFDKRAEIDMTRVKKDDYPIPTIGEQKSLRSEPLGQMLRKRHKSLRSI